MAHHSRDVWITGVGLISSLGESGDAHLNAFIAKDSGAVIDEAAFAPYPIHPMTALDLGQQIPKKSDQRQMEPWQRIGVYAAGMALDDAGIARNPDLLRRTHLVVAAGSGERDNAVDAKVLETMGSKADPALLAKEVLPTALRPTLFLAQLSNLLAGNISIIHNVTASSRTFMGEEMAGLSAMENAVRRVQAGQADVVLVGGALNAERADLLLGYELGHNLWAHPFLPVWQRQATGGGFVPGSVGAFLVIESSEHAKARSARPYARIASVVSDRSQREEEGDSAKVSGALVDRIQGQLASGPLGVLSGASGAEPATREERAFLADLAARGCDTAVRAYGSRLGHSVEAHFPAGVALSALALKAGTFFPPFEECAVERHAAAPPDRILVTSFGHWRGEGVALVERIG